MKSIHIRDLPEVVVERLKRRALRHHRSLQGELQKLLTDAANQEVSDDSGDFSIVSVKTRGTQNWSREAMYED